MIYMRSIEKLDKFTIDRESIIDETRLAKSFTIRHMQFITSDPQERKNQLKNDLKYYFMSDFNQSVGIYSEMKD